MTSTSYVPPKVLSFEKVALGRIDLDLPSYQHHPYPPTTSTMARTRLQAAKQQNDDLATERIGVITRKMAVASQSAAGALTAAVAGLTSTA